MMGCIPSDLKQHTWCFLLSSIDVVYSPEISLVLNSASCTLCDPGPQQSKPMADDRHGTVDKGIGTGLWRKQLERLRRIRCCVWVCKYFMMRCSVDCFPFGRMA